MRPGSRVATHYLWIDREPRPGDLNMAIDHALLDLAAREGAVFLRLYRWSPYCLSVGRHEPATRRYDRDRIAALELSCVRRPTGGRAVWHARELTYAVAAPIRFGGLASAYSRIHALLAEGLRSLGADPQPAPRPSVLPGPGAGACFAAAVGGELLVAGRKVIGSAQLRTGDGLLQHGSLLLEDDQEMVRRLLVPDPSGRPGPRRNGAEGRALEAPLSNLLGRRIGFDEAAEAVGRAAQDWSPTWDTAPVHSILARSERHRAHYRDPAWTWQR